MAGVPESALQLDATGVPAAQGPNLLDLLDAAATAGFGTVHLSWERGTESCSFSDLWSLAHRKRHRGSAGANAIDAVVPHGLVVDGWDFRVVTSTAARHGAS